MDARNGIKIRKERKNRINTDGMSIKDCLDVIYCNLIDVNEFLEYLSHKEHLLTLSKDEITSSSKKRVECSQEILQVLEHLDKISDEECHTVLKTVHFMINTPLAFSLDDIDSYIDQSCLLR